MKLIEVLNKISNGEKIRFLLDGCEYSYSNKYETLHNVSMGEEAEWYIYEAWLNEEVEILEEDKKIEKVFHCNMSTSNKEIEFIQENINQLSDKINEIIDKIENLEEGK